MDEDDVGPCGAEAIAGGVGAMGGVIVGDPEHPASGAVRLLAHDLRDEALEGDDAGLALATSEQLGAMHVPRSKVCPSTQACIFMLDINWAAWGGRQRGMFASPGLNAGLLVGAQRVVACPPSSTLSTTLIKIQAWAPPAT